MHSLKRLVRREPSFAFLVVMTMALGLAAVTTLFALVNGILLESLPYADADRIQTLNHAAPKIDIDQLGTSQGLIRYYQEQLTSVEELALYQQRELTLTGQGPPQRVITVSVTPSFFRVLSTSATLGRTFTAEEGLQGGKKTVVLSHDFWQTRFGGESKALGQHIDLDGDSWTIAGVMPSGFAFPQREVAAWTVLQVDPNPTLVSFSGNAILKTKEGVTSQQLQAELEQAIDSIEQRLPDGGPALGFFSSVGLRPVSVPLLDSMVESVRWTLWLLLGTSILILLVASANTANLFLIRAEQRSRELGIRSALGATRRELVRELLRENGGVAALAGGLALLFSFLILEAIKTFGSTEIPRLHEVSLGWSTVFFAAVLSLVAGNLLGLIPALRGTRNVLASVPTVRSATPTRDQNWTRSGLIATQTALALVLLVGAGLLLRTLVELRAVDPGFKPHSRLAFNLHLAKDQHGDAQQRARLAQELQELITSVPGVESVGVSSWLPFAGGSNASSFWIEGAAIAEDELPPLFIANQVSANYLQTLEIPLLEGRFFTEMESTGLTGNVIVNRALADRHWPDQSALGKRLRQGNDNDTPWQTVVGVVADSKHLTLQETDAPQVFEPLLGPDPENLSPIGQRLAIVVHTSTPPGNLFPSIRTLLNDFDPTLPMSQVATLEEMVASSHARVSFLVLALMIGGFIGVALAAIGLYGAISYLVSKRTKEMGIRLALGAKSRDVVRQVLNQGLRVSAIGIAVGWALALFSTQFLEAALFGVAPRDPLTFASGALLILTVSSLASWFPAVRASRVDPMIALRHE